MGSNPILTLYISLLYNRIVVYAPEPVKYHTLTCYPKSGTKLKLKATAYEWGNSVVNWGYTLAKEKRLASNVRS
jgi:hypothetical protein